MYWVVTLLLGSFGMAQMAVRIISEKYNSTQPNVLSCDLTAGSFGMA